MLLLAGSTVSAASGLKVERIVIKGNTVFSSGKLREVLKSRTNKRFNPRFLRLDQVLLTNYYTVRGYLDAYIAATFTRDGDKVTIEFDIREGRRYYLKEIKFAGGEIISEFHLRERFQIEDGSPFERRAIDEGLNTLESYYLNHGKPYVLFSDQQEVSDDSLITVKVFIVEGETVEIAEIDYQGLQLVKPFLLRRELAIHKGDTYSLEKLEKSQRNIYSTGLFKFVDYRMSPIDSDQTRAKLVWRVTEKKSMWAGLRFGIGRQGGEAISNATTLDFTAEAGHRNIAGTARSVTVRVVPSLFYGSEAEGEPRRLSNPRNQYSFTYVEPWVLNTRTPGIFRLSYSQQRPPISTERLDVLTTSFTLSHNFGRFWSYKAGVSFQKVSTNKDSVLQTVSQGQDLIYALSINPEQDKRDNVLNPRRGFLMDFVGKLVYSTSPRLRGDEKIEVVNTFFKAIAQWNRYQAFTPVRKWVLATRIRGGGLLEFAGRKPVEDIPVTERFYLGGASTIRGYAEQSIGRSVLKNREVVPVGGKYALLANAELRIPLFWILYAETFVDAGNLWEEYADIRPLSLKVGSGAGLAIVTPFGPIRFDYGAKLFPKKDESFGAFHIGISFAY